MTRETLLPAARAVVEKYFHIPVAPGKTVSCPYYRNPRSGKERWGLNAYSGKGSPKEIYEEIAMVEKLEDKSFAELSEKEIQDTMRKRKLGIECSGFLAHVYDAWSRELKHASIARLLRFPHRGLYGRIAAFLRPFAHIDVEILSREENALRVSDWKELRPGDFLRFFKGEDAIGDDTLVDHAILITDVERDDTGALVAMSYAHTVREKEGTGMKRGYVKVVRPGGTLLEQEWREEPDTSTVISTRGTPTLYRPRFLAT